MAKKTEPVKKSLERTYVVPLRSEWIKVPNYKKAKKASVALKQFLVKHMKSDNIKIGKHLNEAIWARGMKNPPHHVKINAVKDADGIVKAELIGKPIEDVAKKPEEPIEEKKKPAAKKEEKAKEKKTEEKPTEEKKPEEKKEEKPAEKKEEVKGKPAEKVPTAAELAKKKE